MANPKILEKKQSVIDEITNNVKESSSFIFLDNNGLTVKETMELRRKLKESNSELRVYKNTLVARALKEPIKAVSEFAKTHENLVMKIGIVDGKVTLVDELKKLATIPSREGLLTMFASGLLAIPRDFAICLNLHSEKLEN